MIYSDIYIYKDQLELLIWNKSTDSQWNREQTGFTVQCK